MSEPDKKKPDSVGMRPRLDFSRVEFHRNAVALLPELTDPQPGVAMIAVALEQSGKNGIIHRSCSCPSKKNQTCIHLKNIERLYAKLNKNGGIESLDQGFRSSTWYRIADVLAQESIEGVDQVTMGIRSRDNTNFITLTGPDGQVRVSCPANAPAGWRLAERFGNIRDEAAANRGNVIEQLHRLTLTDTEWAMLNTGFISRGMARQKTFWYRLAYHGYREYGDAECRFFPAVDEATGQFLVTVKDPKESLLMTLTIPRLSVKRLLAELEDRLPNQHALAVHPIPLKTVFNISRNTELDLEVRSTVQLIQKDGEAKFFEREDLAKFTYGRLVYLPELKILAELEVPGSDRKFSAPQRVTIKKNQIPGFLDELSSKGLGQEAILSPDVGKLKVYKEYDTFEISPVALDRDWCWLSIHYGMGNDAISLEAILKARAQNQRYVPIADGWVDTASPAFDFTDPTGLKQTFHEGMDAKGRIKVSRNELFRIHAMGSAPPRITGDSEMVGSIQRFLDLVPTEPLPSIETMTSSLREYQKNGVGWLWFLFENHLGGLLCDDMGLGKTHQVMALMVALKSSARVDGPHLVVCPTTVISHWRDKIQKHAPSLSVEIHHGGQRDLSKALAAEVLITSYGVLRRDVDQLLERMFCLAVYDEAQFIKNTDTQAHAAAQAIRCRMKIGLTGTPIENRIEELKALMDLVMPRYLGSDEAFQERFSKPITEDPRHRRMGTLRRLITPFTLRRMKKTVLSELPPKIEDIRSCTLSEDQVRLYREAIDNKGRELVESLEKPAVRVPYLHIFALLSLLKQICDHPALVDRTCRDYERYASGKWELFKELLGEGMASGEKIVVYSQFLGMIDIMSNHLKKEGIDHVCLTGTTRERGEVVRRFNEDPDCRVFLGSLMAGGVGIDLVAASIVIHYDRWWNAAKEDQATDRVHRIGQTRGVQVFKLVTEGTLEEKVGAIIDKKRQLLKSIIREDDPNLLKWFSREELIDILKMPRLVY
jgi:superfamily II DNA or RNA helicase